MDEKTRKPSINPMKGKDQVCADESESKKAKNCEQAPPLPDVMFHDVPPEQVATIWDSPPGDLSRAIGGCQDGQAIIDRKDRGAKGKDKNASRYSLCP
jgi:hypothetical protein